MNNKIRNMSGHVIICGMGRTGRSAAQHLKTVGHEVVVLDRDATRCTDPDMPFIVGNVTGDEILIQAGIERASALIATLDTDAETVYLVLSARSMRPDMTIVARAHNQPSRQKLLLAGATRVLNPQVLGGRRAATFAVQPHVAEFIDAVLHDEDIDIRIQEVMIGERSPLVGRPLNSFDVFGEQAVSLLAVHRHAAGEFSLNPSPDTVVALNDVLIVFGTPDQIAALERLNGD